MSVPPGDGGEKKFNWASELSTIFHIKPIVVFGGGLCPWNRRFSHSPVWFKQYPTARDLSAVSLLPLVSALSFTSCNHIALVEKQGMQAELGGIIR